MRILETYVILALLFAGIWTPGCRAKPIIEPSVIAISTNTPIPIDPEQVLARSGETMESLSTFMFKFEHENGTLEIFPGLQIAEVTGTVSNPGKLSASFNGTFGNSFAVRAELVTTNGKTYLTNPLNGLWEEIPIEVSPLSFFDPAEGIVDIMGNIKHVRLVNKSIDQFLISGELTTEVLAPLLGPVVRGSIVDVEFTIDSETMHLIKVLLTGKVMLTDSIDTKRTISIYGFNKFVTIDSPL